MIECRPSGAGADAVRERNEIVAAPGLRQEIGLRETALSAIVGGIEDGRAGFKRVVTPVRDAVKILIIPSIDSGTASITTEGSILKSRKAHAALDIVDKTQVGVPGQVQPQGIDRVLANLLPGSNLRAIFGGKVAGIVDVEIQQRSGIARTAAIRAENRWQCKPIRARRIHIESDPELFPVGDAGGIRDSILRSQPV